MEIQDVGIKEIKGGITSPKGFHATGNHIGIKENKKDLSRYLYLLHALAP